MHISNNWYPWCTSKQFYLEQLIQAFAILNIEHFFFFFLFFAVFSTVHFLCEEDCQVVQN